MAGSAAAPPGPPASAVSQATGSSYYTTPSPPALNDLPPPPPPLPSARRLNAHEPDVCARIDLLSRQLQQLEQSVASDIHLILALLQPARGSQSSGLSTALPDLREGYAERLAAAAAAVAATGPPGTLNGRAVPTPAAKASRAADLPLPPFDAKVTSASGWPAAPREAAPTPPFALPFAPVPSSAPGAAPVPRSEAQVPASGGAPPWDFGDAPVAPIARLESLDELDQGQDSGSGSCLSSGGPASPGQAPTSKTSDV